jgi:hypothetical protein
MEGKARPNKAPSQNRHPKSLKRPGEEPPEVSTEIRVKKGSVKSAKGWEGQMSKQLPSNSKELQKCGDF